MIGTQIGPFIVLRLLGAGGMGRVYLAEHALMKDLHAIKVLDPALMQHPQLVTRFINEARAAARLRHRNLVRVHNIDRMPGDGPWFMVLDYLDGSTLARFIASHSGPIPARVVLHIVAQVANCMQHVHDHKIVHRDLKPENIFLIRAGDDPHFPVVLDLGVAQLTEELASGPATKTGTVIGTPIYMAPEQLRGERVTPAADVFALGVIAYEMSTGGCFPYQQGEPRSAYVALPATELYFRQRSAPPVDPRRHHPGLGDAWAKVLLAALDPAPAARPASARDFALRLAEAVAPDGAGPDGLAIVHQVARELMHDGEPCASPLIHPSTSGSVAAARGRDGESSDPHGASEMTAMETDVRHTTSTLAAESHSVAPARVRRRRGVLAAAGLAAAVAGALAVVAVDRRHPPSTPTTVDREPRAATAAVESPAATDKLAEPPPATNRLAEPPGATAQISEPTPPPVASSDRAMAAPARDAMEPPRPSPPKRAAVPPRPPPPLVARKIGELVITVRYPVTDGQPWAEVWINDEPSGQTPLRKKLPAGSYRVRLSNKDRGKEETVWVTVDPDRATTLERKW